MFFLVFKKTKIKQLCIDETELIILVAKKMERKIFVAMSVHPSLYVREEIKRIEIKTMAEAHLWGQIRQTLYSC